MLAWRQPSCESGVQAASPTSSPSRTSPSLGLRLRRGQRPDLRAHAQDGLRRAPQGLLHLRFVGDTVRQPPCLRRIDGLKVNILGATVEELRESVLCPFLIQLKGEARTPSTVHSKCSTSQAFRGR